MEPLIHEFSRNLASVQEGCKPGHKRPNYNDQADVAIEEKLSKIIQLAMSVEEAQRMQIILDYNIARKKTSSCVK